MHEGMGAYAPTGGPLVPLWPVQEPHEHGRRVGPPSGSINHSTNATFTVGQGSAG